MFGALATIGVAAGGVLPAVWTSGYSTLVIVVGAIAGALVGFFLVIALIAAISWLLAFPKQRNEARIEVEQLEGSDIAKVQQGRAEAQFAAAIRTRQGIAGLPGEAAPLVADWMAWTETLVTDVFGEVEAAVCASKTNLGERRDYLAQVAARLTEGSEPSESWDRHVFVMRAFRDILAGEVRQGENIGADILNSNSLGSESMVDAWFAEVDKTLALVPDIRPMMVSPWPAETGFSYEGLDSDASNLLGRLDQRLSAIRHAVPLIDTYVAELGEPYGDYRSSASAVAA